MTKKAILLTAIAFTALSSAIAKVNKKLYPYSKALQRVVTSESSSRFGAFDIDEELFNALNKTETNLRITGESGQEVPFLIRTKTGRRNVDQQKAIPFTNLTFNKLQDNRIEVELERNPDKRYRKSKVSNINISSSQRNFEKNVSIWSSDDRSEWKLLAENKPIFDYSRFIDIRNSRISFPQTNAKYLKLQISNISEKHDSPFTRLRRTKQFGKEVSSTESISFTRADFKIDKITLYEKTTRTVKDKTIRQSYTATGFTRAEIDENSVITFSTHNAPITEIRLPTATPYFLRSYRVETSDDQKKWRYVNSGIISRVSDNPDTKKDQLIHLPRATRAEFYRITITNNDSPPLEITGVELEGETREIVFYYDKTETYRLIYGSEKAVRAVYDIAQVLKRSNNATKAEFTAGPQLQNADYSSKGKRRVLLSRRTVMTFAVVLMIAALGWVIAQTVRKIE